MCAKLTKMMMWMRCQSPAHEIKVIRVPAIMLSGGCHTKPPANIACSEIKRAM